MSSDTPKDQPQYTLIICGPDGNYYGVDWPDKNNSDAGATITRLAEDTHVCNVFQGLTPSILGDAKHINDDKGVIGFDIVPFQTKKGDKKQEKGSQDATAVTCFLLNLKSLIESNPIPGPNPNPGPKRKP